MNKYILKHIQDTSNTGYKPKLFDGKEILYFILFLGVLAEIFIMYLIFSNWFTTWRLQWIIYNQSIR